MYRKNTIPSVPKVNIFSFIIFSPSQFMRTLPIHSNNSFTLNRPILCFAMTHQEYEEALSLVIPPKSLCLLIASYTPLCTHCWSNVDCEKREDCCNCYIITCTANSQECTFCKNKVCTSCYIHCCICRTVSCQKCRPTWVCPLCEKWAHSIWGIVRYFLSTCFILLVAIVVPITYYGCSPTFCPFPLHKYPEAMVYSSVPDRISCPFQTFLWDPCVVFDTEIIYQPLQGLSTMKCSILTDTLLPSKSTITVYASRWGGACYPSPFNGIDSLYSKDAVAWMFLSLLAWVPLVAGLVDLFIVLKTLWKIYLMVEMGFICF